MSRTLRNRPIPMPTEGVIRSAVLNDAVSDPRSAEEAINVHFDSIGAITGRLGLSQYATAPAGNPIISYGQWSENASTNRQLLAQVGNTIYAWDGTTWSNVRTLTSTNKARYTQFLNLTYMVNGSNGDAVQTYDGTSFGTTNVGALPPGDFISAGFEGRVWVADASLDRLYYTDVVEDNAAPPPEYIITGGTSFIEKLSPQDGDQITALVREPRALLVFKKNAIFRVYGSASVDPYPAYFVGTYSQESIIRAKDGHYFHHSTGFYKFQFNSQPQEISRKINDFVQAIPRDNYEDIFGWSDADHLYWSVGDVTIRGRIYTNVVLRYTLSMQVWTIYSYNQDLTASIVYDDGQNINALVGTSQGITALVNSGTTDLGSPIFMNYKSRSFGVPVVEQPTMVHDLKGLSVTHQNATGMNVYGVFDKDDTKRKQLGNIDNNYVSLFRGVNTETFNSIAIEINGSYIGTPPVVEGIEILEIEEKGHEHN